MLPVLQQSGLSKAQLEPANPPVQPAQSEFLRNQARAQAAQRHKYARSAKAEQCASFLSAREVSAEVHSLYDGKRYYRPDVLHLTTQPVPVIDPNHVTLPVTSDPRQALADVNRALDGLPHRRQ